MTLLQKLKVCINILLSDNFYIFTARGNHYRQVSNNLQINQADLIIDSLVEAADIAEAETNLMNQINQIINNGISQN